jgi:hypothetical protein
VGTLRRKGRLAELARSPTTEPFRTNLKPLALPQQMRAAQGHPWPYPLPAAWSGRFDRSAGPEPYVRVEPLAVAEVVVDGAYEHGRWRHAVRHLRLRPDLGPADVTGEPRPGDGMAQTLSAPEAGSAGFGLHCARRYSAFLIRGGITLSRSQSARSTTQGVLVVAGACDSADWSPIDSAASHSQLAGVVAGLVFAGIVVILERQAPGRRPAEALTLFVAGFFTFALDGFFFGVVAGERTCPRAWTETMVAAGLLGFGLVLPGER